MSYLLDTNTVSELIKPNGAASVSAWIDHLAAGEVYLSVATFAEARRGAELMDVGRRRDRLMAWLETELPLRFAGRILTIDRAVAEAWGIIMARSRRLSRPISILDCFFAATAEVHGLTLATRNTRHFVDLGIPVYDPWTYLP